MQHDASSVITRVQFANDRAFAFLAGSRQSADRLRVFVEHRSETGFANARIGAAQFAFEIAQFASGQLIIVGAERTPIKPPSDPDAGMILIRVTGSSPVRPPYLRISSCDFRSTALLFSVRIGTL